MVGKGFVLSPTMSYLEAKGGAIRQTNGDSLPTWAS
jgi:hypothetical protein